MTHPMEAEYERLIRPLEDQMIRTIWRIVHDPDDADDAMQEALATMWRRLDRIREHNNPRALILRICINSACDVLRRKARQTRCEKIDEYKEELRTPGTTVVDALADEDTNAEIIKAIGQLSPQQSEAVLRRLVREESYTEIARALECSEATARTHVARGRTRLRDLLAHLAPSVHARFEEAEA